jgi:hypothetical protein
LPCTLPRAKTEIDDVKTCCLVMAVTSLRDADR